MESSLAQLRWLWARCRPALLAPEAEEDTGAGGLLFEPCQVDGVVECGHIHEACHPMSAIGSVHFLAE